MLIVNFQAAGEGAHLPRNADANHNFDICERVRDFMTKRKDGPNKRLLASCFANEFPDPKPWPNKMLRHISLLAKA